jgi:hypothetical protein
MPNLLAVLKCATVRLRKSDDIEHDPCFSCRPGAATIYSERYAGPTYQLAQEAYHIPTHVAQIACNS